jgi:hypothetical protein
MLRERERKRKRRRERKRKRKRDVYVCGLLLGRGTGRLGRMPNFAIRSGVGALEAQLDIHEVVGRPGSGILEGQQVLVLAGECLDRVIELLFT